MVARGSTRSVKKETKPAIVQPKAKNFTGDDGETKLKFLGILADDNGEFDGFDITVSEYQEVESPRGKISRKRVENVVSLDEATSREMFAWLGKQFAKFDAEDA